MYFIANWKMYGDVKSINTLDKVIKFSKSNKSKKFKLIYCPPYTLLNLLYEKLKKTNIDIGGQNCHYYENNGAYTGSVSSLMLKMVGAKFVIIGHSENRQEGDTDQLINTKIQSSLKNKLKIIFCIGETLSQKKRKLTQKVLFNQIKNGLRNIKNLNNIIFAYEPIWSIGTGIVPKNHDLKKNIEFIKKKLNKNFKLKNPKVLYGGSVNPKNIRDLKEINEIDGFLIGGASLDSKKFIDIVQKTFI